MVHSLEHGHTILWYDDTVKPGTDAYKDVQAIAKKFDAETDKFMAAPWKSSDGKSFPERQARRPDPLDRAARTRRASPSTAPPPAARSCRRS